MDLKLGLIVKLPDPASPANLVTSQFATIRGHREMEQLLRDCAKADVAEWKAARAFQLAVERLQDAKADELDAAAEAAGKANEERIAAHQAVCDAVRAFVEGGFRLAGSSPEKAAELAALVGPEQLDDLKAKCQFGAGVLDFTREAAR